MRLLLAHPEVAYRPCAACMRWHFDPKTGELLKRLGFDKDTGKRVRQPVPKRPGEKHGCWQCPKCDSLPMEERTPENGKKADLSARNWRALQFYFEQKACGGPVDAVARRNCGIIEAEIVKHQAATGRAGVEMLRALARLY